MSYSGHALRHTIGTIVERQAGFEVAKSMLRHKRSSTTDTYVMAGPAEVARAISEITGCPHPLAQ
jgi:site-specific recombinase XerD